MTYIFNLGVIGFVLLIAYWWVNQGAFSAFLHLLAVIGAGIIALGLWEPVAFLMLRGNTFDYFAWGVSLIGLFSISLFLLRFLLSRSCVRFVQLLFCAALQVHHHLPNSSLQRRQSKDQFALS